MVEHEANTAKYLNSEKVKARRNLQDKQRRLNSLTADLELLQQEVARASQEFLDAQTSFLEAAQELERFEIEDAK